MYPGSKPLNILRHRKHSCLAWSLVCVICFHLSILGGEASHEPALTFERDVRPIFKAMCFHCHGEDDHREGGLDLRLVRLMKGGGDEGPAIVPGSADTSLLWQRISEDEMPEGETKLTPAEKSVIHDWINAGAITARPEPDNVEDARFTEEEINHWSFKKLAHQPVPERVEGFASDSPIDSFIHEKLTDYQLTPAQMADRATLIRRLSFDLRGLPPSEEDLRAFTEDTRQDPWSPLVDQMLASPHFGERWGGHWLDLAGFAESDGGSLNDPERPYAWRYRDYVVESLNANLPIDRFFQEQLAGDEMIQGSVDPVNAEHQRLLSATGFLLMAPDATRVSNTLEDRNNAAAEVVKVVSSSMLGLTVGCAQCHDHKYDPIGIDDYYRFRAVFDPILPLESWKTHDRRLFDFTPATVRSRIESIEAEAKALEDTIKGRRDVVALRIQEERLALVPEDVRDVLRDAVVHPSKERTEQQKELLEAYPMVKPLPTIIGLLVEYEPTTYREFEKEFAKVSEIRGRKPDLHQVMTPLEDGKTLPVSRIFFRGNPESPKEEVEPSELRVLQLNGTDADLPMNDTDLLTSGRRLAYARHLTSGDHPLTARVFVNRVWMHLMGSALVRSTGDFGIAGEMPSHPELLDWLSLDFVAHQWDLKHLIRRIVLSHTYRQSSRREAEADSKDPVNQWYARANLKRMDAESLRDAILVASGLLDSSLGGASLPVTENAEGKTVIGVRKIKDGLKAGVDAAGGHSHRRSLYVQRQRNKPLDMLATFDLPVMTPNCEVRKQTTVATQSLYFLNDESISQYVESLLHDTAAETRPLDQWVGALYQKLFAARPTSQELQHAETFITGMEGVFAQADKDAAQDETGQVSSRHQALALYAQTLFASNRFLYID